MDYGFGNRNSGYGAGSGGAAASFYPRVGQPGPSPAVRAPHHHPPLAPSSSSATMGIKVAIKPEYRITPPPQLAPQLAEIPRSTFQFDFEFEKRILAEAEKDSQNWNKISVENQPSKSAASSSSMNSPGDPVVEKYVASGLGREAVSLAVLNYGDNPIKVREFVKGYNLLREMGFSSKNVAEALAMYDNDTDKALAHFLNSSS